MIEELLPNQRWFRFGPGALLCVEQKVSKLKTWKILFGIEFDIATSRLPTFRQRRL